mgnify:CR=1 FL=1
MSSEVLPKLSALLQTRTIGFPDFFSIIEISLSAAVTPCFISVKKIITSENFETEVKNSDKPVLLDLWAEWCGPCKMLSPVISEIAEEYEGRLKVGKINVDEQQQLAAMFGVESIPLVLLIKDGKTVDSSVGYRPKEQIKAFVDKNI